LKLHIFVIGIVLTMSAECFAQRDATDNKAEQHIFPQFAHGRLSDGTFYRSTLMVYNPDARSNECLWGFWTSGQEPQFVSHAGQVGYLEEVFTIAPGQWGVFTSTGEQPLAVGHATLQCDYPMVAQVLFSFYDRNDFKLSEATVFSAPAGKTVALIADQRNGVRLGIAMAGTFVGYFGVDFELTATSVDGSVIGRATVSKPGTGNVARFLDDLIPATRNRMAVVSIKATGSSLASYLPVYLIGLRYTGGVFTTIPAMIVVP